MFFEYPKLLWLLLVPALLVLRYVIIEIKDRRPHLRVSKVVPWKAGGRSVLGIVRHIPFILRTAALCLIVICIARPRSSTKVDRVDTEGIDIVFAMDVSTSMLARDFTPDRIKNQHMRAESVRLFTPQERCRLRFLVDTEAIMTYK